MVEYAAGCSGSAVDDRCEGVEAHHGVELILALGGGVYYVVAIGKLGVDIFGLAEVIDGVGHEISYLQAGLAG